MKIKEGFVLRSVADTWAAIPVGSAAAEFNGMLNLNDSGAMLWQLLERGARHEELLQAMLDRYEVTQEQASEDVAVFLNTLRQAGCVEDEEGQC